MSIVIQKQKPFGEPSRPLENLRSSEFGSGFVHFEAKLAFLENSGVETDDTHQMVVNFLRSDARETPILKSYSAVGDVKWTGSTFNLTVPMSTLIVNNKGDDAADPPISTEISFEKGGLGLPVKSRPYTLFTCFKKQQKSIFADLAVGGAIGDGQGQFQGQGQFDLTVSMRTPYSEGFQNQKTIQNADGSDPEYPSVATGVFGTDCSLVDYPSGSYLDVSAFLEDVVTGEVYQLDDAVVNFVDFNFDQNYDVLTANVWSTSERKFSLDPGNFGVHNFLAARRRGVFHVNIRIPNLFKGTDDALHGAFGDIIRINFDGQPTKRLGLRIKYEVKRQSLQSIITHDSCYDTVAIFDVTDPTTQANPSNYANNSEDLWNRVFDDGDPGFGIADTSRNAKRSEFLPYSSSGTTVVSSSFIWKEPDCPFTFSDLIEVQFGQDFLDNLPEVQFTNSSVALRLTAAPPKSMFFDYGNYQENSGFVQLGGAGFGELIGNKYSRSSRNKFMFEDTSGRLLVNHDITNSVDSRISETAAGTVGSYMFQPLSTGTTNVGEMPNSNAESLPVFIYEATNDSIATSLQSTAESGADPDNDMNTHMTSVLKPIIKGNQPLTLSTSNDIGGDIKACTLVSRYYTLTQDEAQALMSASRHDYLQTKTVFEQYDLHDQKGGLLRVPISYRGAIREIIWFYRKKSHELEGDQNMSYFDFRANRVSPFLGANRMSEVQGSSHDSSSGVQWTTPSDLKNVYKAQTTGNLKDDDFFTSATLVLNNQKLHSPPRDPVYFSYFNAANYHSRVPVENDYEVFYVMSFGLEPEHRVPNGSLNLSNFSNVNLEFTIPSGGIEDGTIYIMIRAHNVVQVQNGMISTVHAD